MRGRDQQTNYPPSTRLGLEWAPNQLGGRVYTGSYLPISQSVLRITHTPAYRSRSLSSERSPERRPKSVERASYAGSLNATPPGRGQAWFLDLAISGEISFPHFPGDLGRVTSPLVRTLLTFRVSLKRQKKGENPKNRPKNRAFILVGADRVALSGSKAAPKGHERKPWGHSSVRSIHPPILPNPSDKLLKQDAKMYQLTGRPFKTFEVPLILSPTIASIGMHSSRQEGSVSLNQRRVAVKPSKTYYGCIRLSKTL